MKNIVYSLSPNEKIRRKAAEQTTTVITTPVAKPLNHNGNTPPKK